MKRTLISLAALLVAGSLVAATEKPATPQTTTAAPDSPLVAAAKKSNRVGKKRIVITDESVKNSKGHITTTKIQHDFKVALPDKPAIDPNLTAAAKAGPKQRTRPQATPEERQRRLARAAAAAEDEGPFQEDPAATEHELEQQSSTASTPTSSQPQPSKHDDARRP